MTYLRVVSLIDCLLANENTNPSNNNLDTQHRAMSSHGIFQVEFHTSLERGGGRGGGCEVGGELRVG